MMKKYLIWYDNVFEIGTFEADDEKEAIKKARQKLDKMPLYFSSYVKVIKIYEE